MADATGAAEPAIEAAFAPCREEGRALLPEGTPVLDAHTHLGVDEDGQSLALDALLAALDEVATDARACTFPLHDPDRHPGYRLPNDRVLQWAAESGGGRGAARPPRPAQGPGRRGRRRPAARARGRTHP